MGSPDIDFASSALVIVDLQLDFIDGSLAVSGANDIIEPINELCHNPWKTIIASKDWHPYNHCSFASVHNMQPFSEITYVHPFIPGKTIKSLAWPDHCVQDTIGAEFPATFDSSVVKHTVLKGFLQDREYYSAFHDIWGIHNTELKELLDSASVKHVYCVGVAFDYCVLHTALDSAKAGFKTTVLGQYSRAVSPQDWQSVTEQLTAGGVSVTA